jgi:hypothetical protein
MAGVLADQGESFSVEIDCFFGVLRAGWVVEVTLDYWD